MGLIVKILSFFRITKPNGVKLSEIKGDVGGGDIRTAEHYGPAGDDSVPLLTDKAIGVEIPRSGGIAIVGYLDPLNDGVAQAGEKRIYARELSSGDIVCNIYLKANGSIIGANDNGSFELKTGGDFIINGLTIDNSGNISGTGTISMGGDITSGVISLPGHKHPILSGSSSPGPTGPSVP